MNSGAARLFLMSLALGPNVHYSARSASGPISELRVWTAGAMERISQTEAARSKCDFALSAARGEFESFQIVVNADSAPEQVASIRASDLVGPDGAVIPSRSFAFYREHYVLVSKSSPDLGTGNRPLAPGAYADALVPFADPITGRPPSGQIPSVPFVVAPNSAQPVWVDLEVPRDTPAGLYQGAVTVFAGSGSAQVPVCVRVRNFDLPLKPSLQSSFGLHGANSSDPRTHELLLRHKVMPDSVNPQDSERLERDFGMNSTALRFYSHVDRGKCTMDAPPAVAAIDAARRQYPSGLKLRVYSADEVDRCPALFPTIQRWAASIHAADPAIKNLVTVSPTATLYDDGGGAGRSAVDIWALLPKAYEAANAEVRTVQARGDEVWSYTALVQETYSPKWEIDFSPIDYRIQPGFISQSLGLTGILYWSVDRWTRAPWTDVYGYSIADNSYPGEGMLIYPGANAGMTTPVPSMRLKWIRDGVEDFEYLAILRRLGKGTMATAFARRVGSDWRNWTRDPALLESVRQEIGDAIEASMGRTSGGAQ